MLQYIVLKQYKRSPLARAETAVFWFSRWLKRADNEHIGLVFWSIQRSNIGIGMGIGTGFGIGIESRFGIEMRHCGFL